jgi:hypothetical protein
MVWVPAACGWTCVVAAGETLEECVIMSGPMVFVTAIILALTTGFTTRFTSDRWTDPMWLSMRMWSTGRNTEWLLGAFHQRRMMMLTASSP